MGTSLAENELHGNIVKEIKYNSFREFYIENFYLMTLTIEDVHILNGKTHICIEAKVIQNINWYRLCFAICPKRFLEIHF